MAVVGPSTSAFAEFPVKQTYWYQLHAPDRSCSMSQFPQEGQLQTLVFASMPTWIFIHFTLVESKNPQLHSIALITIRNLFAYFGQRRCFPFNAGALGLFAAVPPSANHHMSDSGKMVAFWGFGFTDSTSCCRPSALKH